MEQERSALPTIWNAPSAASGVDISGFIGKKPSRTVPVHHEHRRQTLSRERDILVAEIKNKTGCTVIPHLEKYGRGKIDYFDVFGSGGGLDRAVSYLNDWISNANAKSIGSSAWAKLSAYDPDEWYYTKVQQLEDQRKERFRGPIPEEGEDEPVPKHAAIVVWPEDLATHPLNPRDMFGNKLERLDALRMQDEVFINPDVVICDETWLIQIVGYDMAAVKTAQDHLYTVIEKLRADVFGVQHMLNIILDQREGLEVELQRDEPWWPNHADPVVPRLLPSPMMDDPGSFRQDGLDSYQLSSLQKAIKAALDNVRFRKGSYDFAVRLGCVALSSKDVDAGELGKKFPTAKVLKQVNDNIEVNVKKWLADDEMGYLILHRLMAADGFLEPTKSATYFGCTPASLPETRPIFRGTWVFRDPNSAVGQSQAPARLAGRPAPLNGPAIETFTPGPTSLFVIQVDWTEDEERQYEKGAPVFYKLDSGKNAPKKNMDISLLELGESRAWHFALESMTQVYSNTVPPVLVGFADRVAMKPKYKVNSKESFATWDSTPTIKKSLLTGRLDSIYAFGIKNTCYKVELTAMWYPGQIMPVWGLAVRHPDWATHLAELESLLIGGQASWGDTLSTFFPDDGESDDGESIGCTDDCDDDYGMGRLRVNHGDGGEDGKGRAKEEDKPCEGIRTLADNLLKLSEIVSSVTEGGGIRI